MQQVSFQTKNCCFVVELNNGLTAREIVKALPLDSAVSTWGDEVYFETNTQALYDDIVLTSEVDVGDVAYWPQGRCICVFFGPTPISKAGKPVPASGVVIVGKTRHSPSELRRIKTGDSVRVVIVGENQPQSSRKALRSDRRLTQTEIDALVQQLLAEKAKQELAKS